MFFSVKNVGVVVLCPWIFCSPVAINNKYYRLVKLYLARWKRRYDGICRGYGVRLKSKRQTDGVSLCFVLETKLPAAGWQAVVNSADCQDCDAARCPPFFLLWFYYLFVITVWPKAEAGAAGMTQQV